MLGLAWAFATPPPVGEAGGSSGWSNFHADEGSHLAVTRFMAENPFTLPPYRPPFDTSIHLPLYHGLAALVFRAAYPVLGAAGGARAARVLSVLMGVGTVWFAYRAALQSRLSRGAAVCAGLLVALVPMRASVSGAVTNENLAALGAAATLALLYECLRRGFSGRRFAWLVFWCVVAVGSKITCAGLILAIGAGMLLPTPPPASRDAVAARFPRFAALLAAVVTAWGWWFAYNVRHFGDPLRARAADRLWDGVQPGYAVIGPRYHMAPWRYLISILDRGWLSFWGIFDAMAHPLPSAVYVALFAAQLAALIGVIARLRRLLPRYPAERAIWATTGVFVAWVLLVYCQYNFKHYTPQGRYFFVLLAPFGVLMAGGMDAFLRRYLPNPVGRNAAWALLGASLFGVNLYALWVMPRFRSAAAPAPAAHTAPATVPRTASTNTNAARTTTAQVDAATPAPARAVATIRTRTKVALWNAH